MNKWIPVRERLPEECGNTLITHKQGVKEAYWNGKYWSHGAPTKHKPIKTVIAWMPLPEPYEESDNPCRKCNASTRQSCCGCPEYFEWQKKQDDS